MKPSAANRPVYTKSRRTKTKKTRLHGAFKGGFSAGHFNTVGSRSGWAPNDDECEDEDSKTLEIKDDDYYSRPGWRLKARSGQRLSSKSDYKKQMIEDFMDEEDANEWGGPSTVSKDYLDGFGDSKIPDSRLVSSGSIGGLLSNNSIFPSGGSIGKQLLRVLGWREKAAYTGAYEKDETSYVYVPYENDETLDPPNAFLAPKRLRRIELKLSKQKKKIPLPKVDAYGLGYEPFQNAPEFKAYKELRKKRAERRAVAAVSSHGDDRMNVYRTSALRTLYDEAEVDDCVTEQRTHGLKQRESNGGHGDILTYETAEDFIGSKTAGGFALHDDDDDVYDDPMHADVNNYDGAKFSTSKINRRDYHNEVYDASDSDNEGVNPNKKLPNHGDNMNIFAGALSAWASGDSKSGVSSDKAQKIIAVTSDGKPPMEGFTIGNDGMKGNIRRFAGPSVPSNFVAQRHKFPQLDAIAQMKALSSNIKLQMSSRRQGIAPERKGGARQGDKMRDTKPMAGGSFAALSSSLKERFTTSRKGDNDIKAPEKYSLTDPSNVKPLRSTFSWQPAVLLCKRLGVNVPRVSHAKSQDKNSSETREEKFFRQEVLEKMGDGSKSGKQAEGSLEYMLSGETTDVERPTMEYMKSIFDPGSNDDMSISDDEFSDEEEEENLSDIKAEEIQKIAVIPVQNNKDGLDHLTIGGTNQAEILTKTPHKMPSSESESSDASEDDSDRRRRRRRRHHKERRHRKHKREKRDEKRKRKKRHRDKDR